MVRDVAKLLEEFLKYEQEKVESFNMPHMPTLGEAYEEITIQGLNKKYVLPDVYDLRVVKGFIKVGEIQLSQQIDCMLVYGEGIKYGLTDKYIYDVSNVLVIFEVKKNLTKESLVEALIHLSEIKSQFYGYIDDLINRNNIGIDLALFSLHLSYLIGYRIEKIEEIAYLDPTQKNIASTLLVEMLMPLTIVHSYEGYKRVGDLRNAIEDTFNLIDDHNSQRGVRVLDFPTLITNNKLGVLKALGMPYWAQLDEENVGKWWSYLASYNSNSAIILLELLWAKISLHLNISFDFEDDLLSENLLPFFIVRTLGEKPEGKFIKINDHRLKDPKKASDLTFEPQKIEKQLADLFNIITFMGGAKVEEIKGHLEAMNLTKEEFLNCVKSSFSFGIVDDYISIISSWRCVEIEDEYFSSHDLIRFENWLKIQGKEYHQIYMNIYV